MNKRYFFLKIINLYCILGICMFYAQVLVWYWPPHYFQFFHALFLYVFLMNSLRHIQLNIGHKYIFYHHGNLKDKKKCLRYTIYRTRAIISRGLYIFYPIFHCGLYCRAVSVTVNLCSKQGNSSIFGSKIRCL